MLLATHSTTAGRGNHWLDRKKYILLSSTNSYMLVDWLFHDVNYLKSIGIVDKYKVGFSIHKIKSHISIMKNNGSYYGSINN
ncbi:hypothetical protein LX64_03456 [Chitinophaga skermanii]|uniref:Uncharacterized protein n=1 Tax=Chitinophaga skermanii TaxID=331697 RepID=A0A327QDQ0_9BACT|nr:hypothetical protein LX64_03456 [Chitinophaga skermanii]